MTSLAIINTLFGGTLLILSVMHHVVTGDDFWPCLSASVVLLLITLAATFITTGLLHGAIWLKKRGALCARKLQAKRRQVKKGGVL